VGKIACALKKKKENRIGRCKANAKLKGMGYELKRKKGRGRRGGRGKEKVGRGEKGGEKKERSYGKIST